MSRRTVVISSLVVCLVLASICSGMLARVQRRVEPIPIRPVPRMNYVMASPRACLIGPPEWSIDICFWWPTGDAENFPRANGAIRVPVGAKVVFCLSREIEGVWYEDSYGCLGTSLVLQWCRACKYIDDVCPECEPLANTDELTADNATVYPWVTIGRDGAKDTRKGPSIGRAKVGVPVRFRRPGFYYLRGIITTYARPGYTLPLEPWYDCLVGADDPDAVLPPIPTAVDRDIVYVRVRVVDLTITDVEPKEGSVPCPDAVVIKPIPNDTDLDDEEQPGVELDGDTIINLIEPETPIESWSDEVELPLGEQ